MVAQVASLLIDISANVAKITQDMNKAGKAVQGFGDTVKSIGKGLVAAFSVEAVIAYGERVLATVDAMDDLAENLKIATTDFQAFQASALLAGQNMDSVGTAIGKFNVFIGKAAEGSKEQIERLNELGVKILDVNGKVRPTADLLQEVAIAITKISDPARRAAAEVDIFGKSGQAISATLEQFAKGTTALNKELSDLGLIHSPEVVKQIGELNKHSEMAAQKIAVLFAPFYAAAKSKVLDFVAAAMEKFSDAVKAISRGDTDNILKILQGFTLLTTGHVGPAIAVFSGITNEVVALNKAITDTEKEVARLNDGLVQAKQAGAGNEAAVLKKANEAALAELKLTNLKAELAAKTAPPITVTPPSGGAGTPTIKGGKPEVDKFAEAMARLKIEIDGANAAIEEYNRQVAAGETSKEAREAAKAKSDEFKKVAEMIKGVAGITPEQKKAIEEAAALLFSRTKIMTDNNRVMAEADSVNAKYSDGQKKLKNTLQDLDQAYKDGAIGLTEYTEATKVANESAEEQRLKYDGLKGGFTGMAAGFQSGMLSMSNQFSEFQMGQQLFTSTFQLMSGAISEFVEKGTIDFGKLAVSFAKMIADMMAQAAAAAAIKALLKALGLAGGGGATADSLMGLVPASAAAPPGRAAGGPVMGGRAYTVGEQGPETFVPNMPGNIVPNGSSWEPKIVINNNAPGVDVNAGRDNDGNIAVTVERVRRALTRDVQRGGNSFATSLERTYGVARGGA